MIHKALNTLFPPICPITHDPVSEHGDVSPTLWSDLTWIDGATCRSCGAIMDDDLYQSGYDDDHSTLAEESDTDDESFLCAQCLIDKPVYDSAISLWQYNDAARRFILPFKHGDRLELGYWMAKFLYQRHKEMVDACDLMIPVPLHRWRLMKRRYNQSLILGRHLARLSSKPIAPNTLCRTRHTAPQSGNKQNRIKNIAAAFNVPDKKISDVTGKKILLIDDVLTTGSTLNACAQILKKAGATDVHCITVARV